MNFATISFDTHKIIKQLLHKGYSEEQAEGFVEVIQQINLSGVATKEDISDVRAEIGQLRMEMKEQINQLRSEMKEAIAELRSEMKEITSHVRTEMKTERAEMYKFMFVQSLGIVGMTVALIKFLPQL